MSHYATINKEQKAFDGYYANKQAAIESGERRIKECWGGDWVVEEIEYPALENAGYVYWAEHARYKKPKKKLFSLSIEKELAEKIKAAANKQGRSVNNYIERILEVKHG